MNIEKSLIKFSIGLMAFMLLANTAYAELRTSVNQYGITWTFSQSHECGQFANGDWWVVGPVNITSISPAPSGGRHGSMVNPLPMSTQAYDSRVGSYSSSGLFTGGTVSVNSSVVSTISLAVGGNNREILQTAAVLTVLGSVPPDNGATVFRPPYLGNSKPLYSINDLDPSKLQSLPLVSSAPAASTLPGRYKRLQLDHLAGTQTRGMMPTQNMVSYGAGNTRDYGVNYLLLSLNYGMEYRMPLLISMVQIGIDNYRATQMGMEWLAGGGYSSGKKLTILFAGHMLNNADMLNLMQWYTGSFAEDCQTFYTTANPPTEWGGGIYETLASKYGPNYARYGQRHCTNPTTAQYHGEIARGGGSTYSTYWPLNAYSWVGQTLAALFYDLKDEWAHNAYFDHEDRYIETKGFEGTWGSTFADEMWATYRHNFTPIDPTIVATPTISPSEGTYTGSVTVDISTTTSGATIYYTEDGSTPDQSSSIYTQPITYTSSVTVKAKAYKSGLDPSAVKTASYTITTDSQPPVISSVPNTHSANQVVVIFNESVTTATAENISNYSIDNGIAITAASLGADQKTVTLSTSTLSSSTTYTVTVNNIEDFWGNIIAANSIATFQYIDGQTSDGTWQSFTVSTQTGTFTATFDAIPNGNNIDAITGIQNGSASAYGDLACIVRFNTSGQLDARNGNSYTSTNTVNYSSGTSYHFRLEINVPSHTYSVYVTPQGQSEVTLASNFAFRTEQASVSQLTGWTIYAYDGSHLVGNMSFSTGGGDTEAPNVPTSLTAGTVTTNSVALSWNASTDNVGVAGYKVYTNGANPVNVAGTSTTISGLSASTQYSFTVSAYDAASNESAQSSALQVTTDDPADSQAPSVPTSLTAGTVTTNSVGLSWNASTDNVGVTGYKVYTNGANPQSVAGTSTTISGLSASTQYSFTVSAYDAASNESAQSSAIQVTTEAISSVTSNSAWQSFPISTQTGAFTATFDVTPNGSAIDGVTGILNGTASVYDDVACIVRFSTSGQIDARNGGSYTSDNTVNYSSGTSYHFRLEIDVPSHTYSVYVTPQGQSEITLASDYAFRTAQQSVTQLTGWALYAFVPSHTVDNMTFSAVAPDTEAPSVPTGLTTSNITTSSVDLNWNASTDNVGVTGYKVYTNGSNPQNVAGTSATISGLNDATSYTFTVSAVDAASNESAQSGGVNATTLDGTAPSVPTGLASSNITTSSVDLSWNASVDNVGVTGYKVYTNGSNPQSVAGTSATITGLSASTQYSFSVSAIDAASNESAQSSAIQVTTATPPDTEAPSVPTGLAASNITTTGFTLSWTASTDNVGVTGYDVYKDGALETSVTGTSTNITGLTAATTYSMTVKAKDAAQNISAASSALNVTTASGAPITSNGTWQSFPISTQTGAFTATFDVTPNGSSIDGVTGILNGTASAYDDLACIVRFSTSGQIDARNGGSYTSDNTVNYSSGTSYHFRLEINVSSHTYSVYVTPQGQSEVTLASNFAFRTAQQSATQLTGWALYAYVPSHTVSNVTFISGSNADVNLTETIEASSVKIYPNPINGNTLNIQVNGYTEMLNINIYDLAGRSVYNQIHAGSQPEIQIPANELNKGIYIISVKGKDINYQEMIIK